MERKQSLDRLRNNPEIPVLIIGAGVNGIGSYRDLVAQGVDVVIVDRGDFCSGASSASSHMLHGGIRYLENGEFRLVREALTERNLMLRNAPHYAQWLPTTVPIFRWFSGLFNAPLKFLKLRDKPAERGAIVIKIGMTVYDIFARNYRIMPTHTFRLKKKSLEKYPKMNSEIICTGTYYDSFMPTPERICIDMLRDAESLPGESHALNYVSAIDSDGTTVTLRDELTGETFEVKPKVVVNAGGPWIDFINRAMGEETRFIGGTKGSHLILDHPELYEACDGTEIFFENDDGRIVLILPYLGKVMVGTTDIRIEDPDEATVAEEEIDYILGMIKKVFPTIVVDRSQIVFQFTGVRPLASSDASYTGNVTRDHTIRKLLPADSGFKFPVYSLVGGKWTSFRAFSEETADVVLETLGKRRQVTTEYMAIGGGLDYPTNDAAKRNWVQRVARETGLDEARVQVLFDRYGTHAEAIARFCTEETDTPLESLPSFSRREVIYLIRTEQVSRLDDLPLRRSLIAWLGDVNDELVLELADICATELGWDADRRNDEIERAVNVFIDQYGMKIDRVRVQTS
ncbi:MAG: FAD-dependent oxidoreductase [Chloroflexota bacterium]